MLEPGQPRVAPLAIAGFVLALLSILTVFLVLPSIPLGVAGLICSCLAKGKIDHAGGALTGGGLALTGIIVSAAALCLTPVIFFVGAWLIGYWLDHSISRVAPSFEGSFQELP